MSYTMPTPFNLPASANRLVVGKPVIRDAEQTMYVPVQLVTVGANPRQVTKVEMMISNTETDLLERNLSPGPGVDLDSADLFFIKTQRATPTGFTAAMDAFRAGATPALRRMALEDHMVAAGHFGTTLTS